ncbi:hypothetical protein TWF696_000260 [Orbilia brochopaga]|uniref:Uncharacterized protein n=1 Tax=Orbilia brochopaga TaxID=3140254 RepID=A0AAV9VB57_9PEZI
MDMTSLSSTLPGNSNGNPNQPSRGQQLPSNSPEPTDDGQTLIEAFQSAARSVTNLYRSSATLIRNSRQDGYTDALSDVLEAIDNESAYNDPKLALSRIRDWVIDRRHESKSGSSSGIGNTSGQSSMPPRQQREMSTESEMDDAAAQKDEDQSRRQDPTYHESQQQQHPQHSQPFTFHPSNPIPQYPGPTAGFVEQLQSPPESSEIFMFNSPVPSAPTSRQNAGSKVPPGSRGGSNMSGGAGTKRRNQQIDFFDLSGFGNFGMGGGGGRDAGGGGGQGNAKRGRFA